MSVKRGALNLGCVLRGAVSRGVVRRSGVFDPGPDPVPDYLFKYKLDGTDSITRVGGNDYRAGVACEDGVGSWYDGTQYETSTGDSSLVAIGTGVFTKSEWVNTSATGAFRNTFSTGDSDTANGFRTLINSDDTAQIRINGTNYNSVGVIPKDGDWHHVTYVSTGSGGSLSIYIDGVLDSTVAIATYNITDAGTLYIGVDGDVLAGYMIGGLDDVRFYDRALAPTEIADLANYRCDFNFSQITTQAWHDASNVNTITSATNLVSRIDDIGTNGDQPLIQLISSAQMSTGLEEINGLNVLSSVVAGKKMNNTTFPVPVSGNLTLTFIARIDGQSANTNASLISMDAGADWQLNAGNTTQFNGVLTSTNLGSDIDFVSGGPYTGPHIWTIVFDKDNSIKKVYVDGVESASGTYTGLLSSIQVLRIFSNRTGNQGVFGLFGEMVIHEDVTENQRQINEGCLAWKWFPTTDRNVGNPNLPVDSPYKLAPPQNAKQVTFNGDNVTYNGNNVVYSA
jgi:hypothetical protein